MISALDNLDNIFTNKGINFSGPINKSRRTPIGHKLMRTGLMFSIGGIYVRFVIALMNRNSVVFVEDFYGGGSV